MRRRQTRTPRRPRRGRPRTTPRRRMPRMRSRAQRPATPARTRPETLDPQAEEHGAAGWSSWSSSWRWPWAWRLRSRPGWSSPTRSPRSRWNRPSTSASGSSSTASSTTSPTPSPGDIVVFHPPAGADHHCRRTRMRSPARSEATALPAADRGRVEPELHQADRRRPGRHAQRQGRPPGRQRRREDRRALHQPPAATAPPAICRKRSRFHPATTS